MDTAVRHTGEGRAWRERSVGQSRHLPYSWSSVEADIPETGSGPFLVLVHVLGRSSPLPLWSIHTRANQRPGASQHQGRVRVRIRPSPEAPGQLRPAGSRDGPRRGRRRSVRARHRLSPVWRKRRTGSGSGSRSRWTFWLGRWRHRAAFPGPTWTAIVPGSTSTWTWTWTWAIRDCFVGSCSVASSQW